MCTHPYPNAELQSPYLPCQAGGSALASVSLTPWNPRVRTCGFGFATSPLSSNFRANAFWLPTNSPARSAQVFQDAKRLVELAQKPALSSQHSSIHAEKVSSASR